MGIGVLLLLEAVIMVFWLRMRNRSPGANPRSFGAPKEIVYRVSPKEASYAPQIELQ